MKQELYDPFAGEPIFDSIVYEARKTNRERDKIDHEQDGAAPGDNDVASLLRCAISALGSGLVTRDIVPEDSWKCVAEGLDMLQQAELRARIIPSAGRG